MKEMKTHTQTDTQTYTQTTQTDIHTERQTYMHIDRHTCTHTCTHTYMHTHTLYCATIIPHQFTFDYESSKSVNNLPLSKHQSVNLHSPRESCFVEFLFS